jgi:hypothetical protein
MWMKLGEEFSNRHKGTIWTGEGSSGPDGLPLFDNYAWDMDPQETVYTLGVRNTLKAILDEAGWYAEWNDGGTVFIFPA